MSLLSENVIPGNHGKVFGTNAIDKNDLEQIKKRILLLKGIKDVIINTEVFPREFIVHTTALVKIEAIEEQVKAIGFHAIPKSTFEL